MAGNREVMVQGRSPIATVFGRGLNAMGGACRGMISLVEKARQNVPDRLLFSDIDLSMYILLRYDSAWEADKAEFLSPAIFDEQTGHPMISAFAARGSAQYSSANIFTVTRTWALLRTPSATGPARTVVGLVRE